MGGINIKKILWIEDDAYRIKDMLFPFEDEGYKIVIAKTGEEALDKLRGDKEFELIILDILISPWKENLKLILFAGIELIKEIENITKDNKIPLVIFSIVEEITLINHAEQIKVDLTHYKIITKGTKLPKDLYNEIKELM